jgi:hypothetical protein
VGKASSAKRVAKLAQKGKGRQIRFQGGTLFPAAVLIIGVLGALLIFYARGTRPDHNSPPTVNDHWHVSYGFYACDQWLPNLTGALEDVGTPAYQRYLSTGVHSHDDGVIHWHASTSKATGTNAKLGVFLDNYDIELTKDKLQFPADQEGGATYEVGETKCTVDGEEKDAVIKVVVYDPYNDVNSAKTYITDFDDIAIKNSTSIAIVFAPEGTNAGLPPTANQLPELGAVDSTDPLPPDVTTADGGTATVAPTPEQSTVPGETTVPSDSTVAGDSTVPADSTTAPDSTTATSAPATTAAASSTTTG